MSVDDCELVIDAVLLDDCDCEELIDCESDFVYICDDVCVSLEVPLTEEVCVSEGLKL